MTDQSVWKFNIEKYDEKEKVIRIENPEGGVFIAKTPPAMLSDGLKWVVRHGDLTRVSIFNRHLNLDDNFSKKTGKKVKKKTKNTKTGKEVLASALISQCLMLSKDAEHQSKLQSAK